MIASFNMYDSMALLAAIPALRAQYFDPVVKNVDGVDHLVIGASAQETGIGNPAALLSFMENGFLKGLLRNHKVRLL